MTVAKPGISTGLPGAGIGRVWVGPTAGLNLSPPMSVLVSVWKPFASWNARAVVATASISRVPSGESLRVMAPTVWRDQEDVTPAFWVVQTRVATAERVPRPGSSLSATWLVFALPASLVQPMTW